MCRNLTLISRYDSLFSPEEFLLWPMLLFSWLRDCFEIIVFLYELRPMDLLRLMTLSMLMSLEPASRLFSGTSGIALVVKIDILDPFTLSVSTCFVIFLKSFFNCLLSRSFSTNAKRSWNSLTPNCPTILVVLASASVCVEF